MAIGNIVYHTESIKGFFRTEVVLNCLLETEGRGWKIQNDQGPEEICRPKCDILFYHMLQRLIAEVVELSKIYVVLHCISTLLSRKLRLK